jgi:ferredoxin
VVIAGYNRCTELIIKEEQKMKLYVDQDLCIACGACINICPAVFDWNDAGNAEAIKEEVPENVEGDALQALEGCPTGAIKEAE